MVHKKICVSRNEIIYFECFFLGGVDLEYIPFSDISYCYDCSPLIKTCLHVML